MEVKLVIVFDSEEEKRETLKRFEKLETTEDLESFIVGEHDPLTDQERTLLNKCLGRKTIEIYDPCDL